MVKKKNDKKICTGIWIGILALMMALGGCAGSESRGAAEPAGSGATENLTEQTASSDLMEKMIDKMIAGMSLREKVLQMFMITPESLTGQGGVTAAGELTRQAIASYPVGGLVYFSSNMENAGQLKGMLENTSAYYEQQKAPKPFLAVDEEGGTVARIGNHADFLVEQFEDMCAVGAR